MNPRPVAVTPLPNYELDIRFENGERRLINMKPWLDKGVFKRLTEGDFFYKVHIAPYKTVAWDDDLDLCPDTLYLDGTPI
jgi:hypothetical protein